MYNNNKKVYKYSEKNAKKGVKMLKRIQIFVSEPLFEKIEKEVKDLGFNTRNATILSILNNYFKEKGE